jgi:hypothetical protein
MSRTVITVVVAAVIAALMAVAFFVTSTSLDDKVRKDAEAQLRRAYGVVGQLAQLEAIDVANKAERLAANKSFVLALKATDSKAERERQARLGFTSFTAARKDNEKDIRPDIIALVDAQGNVVAMSDMPSGALVPSMWKAEGGKDTVIPALNFVLGTRAILSDIWINQESMMRIGVAPVIDPDAPVPASDPDGVVIIGAVVVAYAQTAIQAQNDKSLLGTEIAYYDGQKVLATSFTHGAASDTGKVSALNDILKENAAAKTAGQQKASKVTIDGVGYYVASVDMPRTTTKSWPKDYPPATAGAMVLSPIADAQNAGATIKLFIILLGVGALAMAMLGLYLSHRRLVSQVDQIELGVTDIINGNVDRTFRPVGPELDGLANGLNVMLARLLGRPEPGEEEFDDEGNPIIPGRVEFEEGDEKPQTDPALAALAQESEPDYYKRVFTEYVAARKQVGSPDDVSFENFIAKLKVNEGKLKAQYQCRTVRFRVVTKDNKVTLKPVPIFA